MFNLPTEVMEIIYYKKNLMEHKDKSKNLMVDLNQFHERVYCSKCGKNIMGYAQTFIKKDLKTYINLGEYCCLEDSYMTTKGKGNYKNYIGCYNTLEEEDEEEDTEDRMYLNINEEGFTLGTNPF